MLVTERSRMNYSRKRIIQDKPGEKSLLEERIAREYKEKKRSKTARLPKIIPLLILGLAAGFMFRSWLAEKGKTVSAGSQRIETMFLVIDEDDRAVPGAYLEVFMVEPKAEDIHDVTMYRGMTDENGRFELELTAERAGIVFCRRMTPPAAASYVFITGERNHLIKFRRPLAVIDNSDSQEMPTADINIEKALRTTSGEKDKKPRVHSTETVPEWIAVIKEAMEEEKQRTR
jgi:hypothetical protein